MPRQHHRAQLARKYDPPGQENKIQKALESHQSGVSLRKAAQQHGVPYGTLWNRVHKKHEKTHGGQPVFKADDEKLLVKSLGALGEWGYPFGTFDLRLLAKAFLDRKGATEKKFKNNLPGKEWAHGFLKRWKDELKCKKPNSLSADRAGVSPSIVKEYFKNLEKEIETVPPENIWNYDETNITDDPNRKKKLIFKRSTRYPNQILTSTKTAFSLMFCGSAVGELLPPYVVYRATNVWDIWREGGPRGTKYARSRHGWFDQQSFENWCEVLAFPRLRRLEGKKILIGDNLSSHFSPHIIQTALKDNIHFVFLPANSTHLLQPLDKAFFHPMKDKWRSILASYKASHGNKPLEKARFPPLLKELFGTLIADESGKKNLIAGFRSCGICPLNPQHVLAKLPDSPSDDEDSSSSILSESILDLLKKSRYGPAPKTHTKRQKLHVAPGKSVGNAESDSESEENESESGLSCIDYGLNDEEGEALEEEMILNAAEDGEVPDHLAENYQEGADDEVQMVNSLLDLKTGDFVGVAYENHWYLASIVDLDLQNNEPVVSFLTPHGPGTMFTYPAAHPDELQVSFNTVLGKVSPKLNMTGRVYSIPTDAMDELDSDFAQFLKNNNPPIPRLL